MELIENNSFKRVYRKLLRISCKSKNKIKYLASATGYLNYRCNICGSDCQMKVSELKREEPSCLNCGSTVRMRAVIHMLSTELFEKSLTLTEFPFRPDIIGIGMSDWEGYAIPLADKLGYKNTYFHKDPRMDITSIDPAVEEKFDFIISSDVFEHVAPPISAAFQNVRRILKPDGVLIFTVPYTLENQTKEHFPDLYNYEIKNIKGNYFLENMTRNDNRQIFNDLVFHGGPGATLEMRVFSQSSLIEEFKKAGFNKIKIYKEPNFDYGIYWKDDWSLPMAARAE